MATPNQTTMTEDELLQGLTDAMTLSGWWWRHARRDDLALVMGMQGLPDILAVHPTRGTLLVWELKDRVGRVSLDQAAWLAAFRALQVTAPAAIVDVRVVRPDEYDDALRTILGA